MANTNLGDMFKLFSIAFTPPSASWIPVLTGGDLARDVRAVWTALELDEQDVLPFCAMCAAYEGADDQEVLHELRRDWSHLYLGDPPLIHNSEGMYRKKAEGRRGAVRMINSYAVEVADFMRECGVRRAEKHNDCIDYLEEECDFCAFLANGPQYLVDLGRDPLDLLQQFVDEHVQQWAPGFCADVQQQARTPYFRELAALMAAFLRAL